MIDSIFESGRIVMREWPRDNWMEYMQNMSQSERFPHLADAAKRLRQAQYFVVRAMALLETHPEEGKKALSDALHNMNAAEARIKAEL